MVSLGRRVATLILLLAAASSVRAACDPPTTTTTLAPVCGNGIREVGEACDGGAYCTAECDLVSLGPGCCQGGSTGGCVDAPNISLDYYLYNYCLSLGGASHVPGGVCSAAGTCQILTLAAPAPLCCTSNSASDCLPRDNTPVPNTGALWSFYHYCEGYTSRTYHSVAGAACGPAGICIPQ